VVPQSDKVVLNLIEDCNLNYLDSREALDSGANLQPRDLVMRLYEIPQEDEPTENVIADSNRRMIQAITNINTVASEKNVDLAVDPNYITRLANLPDVPCGVAGDGGGNGGRPFGEPGAPNVKTYDHLKMENDFKLQWALDEINWPVAPQFTGRGVRVAVFDTSPYRISFPYVKRVGEAFPSPLWFPNWDVGGTTMASNHGLFVASLIHQIAPKSHIQLIRVLYEDGCGELWTLNKGLEAYKSRMSRLTGNLNKTVINMSLGMHVPDEDSDPILTSLREDLETLDTLLNDAYEMGAIIIASAGNDSTKVMDRNGVITEERMEMQLPASHQDVLGVAATNPDGNPSCYTNEGEVGAPGGDGGIDSGPTPTPGPDGLIDLCVPRAFTWDQSPGLNNGPKCSDMATCEYGLIGLAETRYGPRYMLWSGTSFAAPLVSGMAALAYQHMERNSALCVIGGGQWPMAQPPTDPLGAGLIDLGNLINTPAQNCVIKP
jgi:subtilisin family serine protease